NYSWFDASPQMGNNFYRIRGFDQAGNFKYSTVVKVLFGKDAPGIVVYPNPIVGNSFTVDMNNMDKGMYNISLINNLGQEVFSQAVMHDGGSVMKTITMRQTLPQGTYQLVLKGDNGMKLTQQVIKD
ncbi:MAG TPA: T9SS type A sorting domain-containing protein, partial [Chitinophagaceae bacterium]|nr:T9SS type A sorting domain-containing protein [Chitinophagaceae bacterium]